MKVREVCNAFVKISAGTVVTFTAIQNGLRYLNPTTFAERVSLTSHSAMLTTGIAIGYKGARDLYQLFSKNTNPLLQHYRFKRVN